MGAIINALAIVLAGFLGSVLNLSLKDSVADRLMEGLGMCVVVMGVSGAIQGQESLILILSMVIGTFIGENVDLDGRIKDGVASLGRKGESRWSGQDMGPGFVAGTMLFCVGSMMILGSLESGLLGDNSTLYLKTVMDGISAFILASTLGAGVIFAALPVLVIEGAIILFSAFFAPILPDPVIREVLAVGSAILVALGLNLMKATQLKVMNFTPAIIIPVVLQFMF